MADEDNLAASNFAPVMKPLRPEAKAGIVALGILAAFGVAFLAVMVREYLTDSPEAQASSGMYAAGDAMLGIAVFGVLAVAPSALGLYWLRPVSGFWTALDWAAVSFALTGVAALGVILVGTSPSPSGWLALLSILRIVIMPVTASTLLACAVFAPTPRHRLMLAGAFVAEGGIFVGIVLTKLILPNLLR